MYENLLFQDRVVQGLSHDISHNSLAPAILFSGPPMAGKLTAALETARVLSCRKNSAWGCDCALCRKHRVLTHTRTVIAGTRLLSPDIAASADVFRNNVSDASRYRLIRSVGKLLRRFDPILWEGEEKKIAKFRQITERLTESLDELMPGKTLPVGKKLIKFLETLEADCRLLQGYLPGGIPIFQIRHLTKWAAHSAGNDHKTVIIDSADRISVTAVSALLKFLEEPPPDTTIIFITDRKSVLLPTIVSRLRDYSFVARKSAEETEILRRVFRVRTNKFSSLKEYIQSWQTRSPDRIQALAEDFIIGAQNGYFPEEAFSIKDKADLSVLLSTISGLLHEKWGRNEYNLAMHERQLRWVRQARGRAEYLNIPIHLILRNLQLNLRLQK